MNEPCNKEMSKAENNPPLDKKTIIVRIAVGVALVLVPLPIVLMLGSIT